VEKTELAQIVLSAEASQDTRKKADIGRASLAPKSSERQPKKEAGDGPPASGAGVKGKLGKSKTKLALPTKIFHQKPPHGVGETVKNDRQMARRVKKPGTVGADVHRQIDNNLTRRAPTDMETKPQLKRRQ